MIHVHPLPAQERADAFTICIRLLGKFEVSVGRRTLTEDEWRLRKARHLIAVLALAPKHRLHRERAIDLLWPEQKASLAANSFHQTLFVARHNLDPEGAHPTRYMQLKDGFLTLAGDVDVWVDVHAFEAAVVDARQNRTSLAYQTALGLYAGDLLPGDLCEDWSCARRESLRQRYLSLLLDFAEIQKVAHDYAAAVDTLRRVLEHDAAHEEAHRALMQLHVLMNNRQQALRQYHLLCESLQRELGIMPDAHSQDLFERIAAGQME